MKKTLLLSLTTVLTGCASMDHTIVVRNATSQKVTELTLQTASAGFEFRYGTLIPLAMAGYTGPMRIEKKDICNASWKDASGQEHGVSLDLSRQSLPRFNGNLEFILNEDGSLKVKPRIE